MIFLQINILASDRNEILAALDKVRAEVEKTPSLEFFAVAVLDEQPQYEAVSEQTEAHDIWELRQ